MKKNFVYSLLLFPAVFAVLALVYGDFIFKAGVTGSGIVILLWIYYRRGSSYNNVVLILSALLLSIAGDWFLSNKHEQSWMFIAGIAFFFFAHIGYLMYSLKNGKINANFFAGLLIVYLAFFFIWLSPGIAGMGLKVAALLYLIISCLSLSAALGINTPSAPAKNSYVAGIFLILFSDTIIAFKEFTLIQGLNFLILPTYYLAQICITFSLMVTMIATPVKKGNI